ncbi:hypothetical protein PG990_002824 [Apiospora arundinis]
MARFAGVCAEDINAAYAELVAKRAQPIVRPVDDDYLSTSPKGVKQRERRWIKREIRRKEATDRRGSTTGSVSGSPLKHHGMMRTLLSSAAEVDISRWDSLF